MPDKYAVITGAARGIGASITSRLAAEGYDVVINYSRSKDRAEALAQELQETYHVQALPCKANVSDYGQMKEMHDFVVEKLGDNIGVLGAMHGIHLFAPHMVEHQFGRIINISSTAGLQGSVNMVDYSAAKGGLNALTKAITLELGQYNVYANAICPGFIKTEGTASLGPELLEQCKAISPMKAVGEADEVAELVAFLVKNPILGGQSLAPNYGQFML